MEFCGKWPHTSRNHKLEKKRKKLKKTDTHNHKHKQQKRSDKEISKMSLESPFKADILKGKVALITGGGSGIGFEISTQFGKHGASVAIMGRRKQVLDAAVSALRSLGIKVYFQRK